MLVRGVAKSCVLTATTYKVKGFPGGPVVNNSPAKAGDTRNEVSISGCRRSSGVGNDNPIHILACTIPWIEESGRYSPWGHRV